VFVLLGQRVVAAARGQPEQQRPPANLHSLSQPPLDARARRPTQSLEACFRPGEGARAAPATSQCAAGVQQVLVFPQRVGVSTRSHAVPCRSISNHYLVVRLRNSH